MSDPEILGEIIARAPGPTPRKKKHKLDLIALNWEYIAGPDLGKRSRPTRISRGTLTVAAEGASWASELSMKTAEISRRTMEVVGDSSVRNVRVQARSGCGGKLGAEGPGETGAGGEGAAPLGEEVAGGLQEINEEKLRGALERMLRASMSSRQSRQSRR